MNDQLQKALADLLAKANQGIDAGATFLQAQLPDVIQQLLMWKAVASFLIFVAVIVSASGLTWVIVQAYRTQKTRRDLRAELKAAERLADKYMYWLKPLEEGQEAEVESAKKKEQDIRDMMAKLPDLEVSAMVIGFFYLPLLLVMGAWGVAWLQIIIAPKLYLIEYAASLAK